MQVCCVRSCGGKKEPHTSTVGSEETNTNCQQPWTLIKGRSLAGLHRWVSGEKFIAGDLKQNCHCQSSAFHELSLENKDFHILKKNPTSYLKVSQEFMKTETIKNITVGNITNTTLGIVPLLSYMLSCYQFLHHVQVMLTSRRLKSQSALI